MKMILSLIGYVLLIVLNFSCTKKNETISISKVKTTIKGIVFDYQRNKPITNYKITLEHWWQGTSVVQAAIFTEFIDSTRTNQDGVYNFTFDAIPNANYGYDLSGNDFYYTESAGNNKIQTGQSNIMNINAWKPIILKLNLDIQNNNYPPLNVKSNIVNNSYTFFPNETIFDKQINKIIYLQTKPEASVNVMFYYATGYTNNDFHSMIPDTIKTNSHDTISLTYKVDCSKF